MPRSNTACGPTCNHNEAKASLLNVIAVLSSAVASNLSGTTNASRLPLRHSYGAIAPHTPCHCGRLAGQRRCRTPQRRRKLSQARPIPQFPFVTVFYHPSDICKCPAYSWHRARLRVECLVALLHEPYREVRQGEAPCFAGKAAMVGGRQDAAEQAAVVVHAVAVGHEGPVRW